MNNKKNINYESGAGFTLVEILVVVLLITLLPAIIIADFGFIKSRFALSRTAHRFAQDLRQTQDLSASAVSYIDEFGEVQEISGYGIYINQSFLGPKRYIIYADNNTGNDSNGEYDGEDYIVSDVDISSFERGVIIKEVDGMATASLSINFSPPDLKVIISDGGVSKEVTQVTFALEGDTAITKTVSVNQHGLIEVK